MAVRRFVLRACYEALAETRGPLHGRSVEVTVADPRANRLQDPLPRALDLVVFGIDVHHLDAAGKADLFAASPTGSGRADGSCSATWWYPSWRRCSIGVAI